MVAATSGNRTLLICSGAATANITPQKSSELADSFDEVPRMRIGKTVSKSGIQCAQGIFVSRRGRRAHKLFGGTGNK